ncbi:MAG: protein kinase [Coxiellaceae bacterium]|nr:protein kinase [Coxiellaceae bacterium]
MRSKYKKTTIDVKPLVLPRLIAQPDAQQTVPSARVIEAMRTGNYTIDASKVRIIGSGMSGVVEVCQLVLASGETKWAARKHKNMAEIDRHLRAMEQHDQTPQSSAATKVVSLLGWDDAYMYTSLGELGSINDLAIADRLAQASTAKEQAKWLSYIFQVTQQMAEGINHIHGNHIAHRDIKGQNIFVDKQGNVAIGDFGLSQTARGGEHEDSKSGAREPNRKIEDLQNAWAVLVCQLRDFNVPSEQLTCLQIIKQELEHAFDSGEALQQAPIKTAQQLVNRLRAINANTLFLPVVLQSQPGTEVGRHHITGISYKKQKSRQLNSQRPRGRVAEVKKPKKRRSSSTPASFRSKSSLFQARHTAKKVMAEEGLHPNVNDDRGRSRRRKARAGIRLGSITGTGQRKRRKSEEGDINPQRRKLLRYNR